jgi:outer membrane protein OmpA-like peptidoglycan-associated protein
MALRTRGRVATAEGGGWGGQLISISDLMAGLLFVFILIVLHFALELNRATSVQIQIIDQMTNALKIREELLQAVDEQLRIEGVDVSVDYDNGILSFRENILFPSGSATLRPEGLIAVDRLARILAEVLPCYTGSPDDPIPPNCTRVGTRGRLEAVFIEGHTDTVRVGPGSQFRDNWDLSAARSISVFKELTRGRADLDRLINANHEPLFSVSGYADRRPSTGRGDSNRSEVGRARNRRIDLRFIMTYPKRPPIVQEMRQRLIKVGVK